MSTPTRSQVHVNRPLTNISIAHVQSDSMFVAAQVFQPVPVMKQSDRYFVYDRGDFNRDEAQKRADATESAGGGYNIDNTPSYFCDVWAFHKDVGEQTRANYDNPLNADRDATTFVTQKLMIRREKAFVTKFFGTGIWGTEVTGVDATPTGPQFLRWNDAASDPIADVRAGKTAVQLATGFRPNTLTMSQQVWDALADHPDIVDRVKYGQTPGSPARVTTAAVAAVMELDNIFVAGAIENTAAEGAAEVSAFIAGKHAMLTYRPPSPGIMTPAAGYTFSWTGLLGGDAGAPQISNMPLPLAKADRIEGEMAFDQKVIGSDLGYFFLTAVA